MKFSLHNMDYRHSSRNKSYKYIPQNKEKNEEKVEPLSIKDMMFADKDKTDTNSLIDQKKNKRKQ